MCWGRFFIHVPYRKNLDLAVWEGRFIEECLSGSGSVVKIQQRKRLTIGKTGSIIMTYTTQRS
jgi:hypothetical protein